MRKHHVRRALLGLSAGLLLAGCIVAEPVVVRTPPPLPPPQVEVVPVQPRPAHLWVQGHWAWRQGSYVWIPGFWEPVRSNHEWIAGHWAPRGDGHVWIEGHWRAR